LDAIAASLAADEYLRSLKLADLLCWLRVGRSLR
jgi:hypothetical protein